MKRVAIIGSVGIPANYGGFETLAEFLSKELSGEFEITVYCSSKEYEERLETHNNSKLVYIPLKANGAQSIPYDVWSISKAVKRNDTLIILGVASGCFLWWFRLFRKRKYIVHIDGCEWKRDKWGFFAKRFLKYSEKRAMKVADVIISDNAIIQEYTSESHNRKSELIEYGANHVSMQVLTEETKSKYRIVDDRYSFAVCRIEPENNVDMILSAFKEMNQPLYFVGNWDYSDYGRKLKERFKDQASIHLIDPIYDQKTLDELRSNCSLYIHGHSAGGTNPSLVEAMQLALPVLAFDVNYNRKTTEDKALYFNSEASLIALVENFDSSSSIKEDMKEIAERRYNWSVIAKKYAKLI